jgi:hypothetical protein
MRPSRVYRWFTLGKNHDAEMCKERDVEVLISDERILRKEDSKPIVL